MFSNIRICRNIPRRYITKGDGATQDIKMQSVWQGENIERRCSAEIMGEYRDEFRWWQPRVNSELSDIARRWSPAVARRGDPRDRLCFRESLRGI